MTMTINGTEGFVFPDNTSQATAATGFGFKNRLLNGAMMIDQRNAGASVTVNAGSAFYATDRFRLSGVASSGVFTGQQVTDAPSGFKNSLKVTVTTIDSSLSGSDLYYIGQNIEGFNTADLNWGAASAATVTISFWVKSSITGTFGGALSNSSVTRSYPFSYTINVANTWEQKSVTIAGDTTGTWETGNDAGIRVYLGLGVASGFSGTAGAWAASQLLSSTGATNLMANNGATFYITGVQLEKGSTATSFDYRPYGTELALCQRYYETNYPAGNAVGSSTAGTTGAQFNVITPANGVSYVTLQASVPKRANATWFVFTHTGTSGSWHYGIANVSETASAISITTAGDKMALIYFTSTPPTNQNTMYGRWVSSAEL